jgi:hypothetical protein
VAVTVISGVVVVPAAIAGGGSIASAPQIGLAQTITSDVQGVEFWRVSAKSGDEIIVRLTTVASWDKLSGTTACLLTPSVTDYTVENARCFEAFGTQRPGSSRELKRVVGAAGTWTLAVGHPNCMGGSVEVSCNGPDNAHFGTTYRVMVLVRAPSTTTLAASGTPNVGKALRLSGVVRTVSGGSVAIQSRQGSRWTTVATRPVSSSGSFSANVKVTNKGSLRLRAFYPGDNTHQPSSRSLTLSVS